VFTEEAVTPEVAAELARDDDRRRRGTRGHGPLGRDRRRTAGGKTGTAERGEEDNPYAWMVAFAGVDEPEVAVAVLVPGRLGVAPSDISRRWPGRSYRQGVMEAVIQS
jgi:cell division protein FtsI/penicillin-binding protein 2